MYLDLVCSICHTENSPTTGAPHRHAPFLYAKECMHMIAPKLRGDMAENPVPGHVRLPRLPRDQALRRLLPLRFPRRNRHHRLARPGQVLHQDQQERGLSIHHPPHGRRQILPQVRDRLSCVLYRPDQDLVHHPQASVGNRTSLHLFGPKRRDAGLFSQYFEAWHLLKQRRPCRFCL